MTQRNHFSCSPNNFWIAANKKRIVLCFCDAFVAVTKVDLKRAIARDGIKKVTGFTIAGEELQKDIIWIETLSKI